MRILLHNLLYLMVNTHELIYTYQKLSFFSKDPVQVITSPKVKAEHKGTRWKLYST